MASQCGKVRTYAGIGIKHENSSVHPGIFVDATVGAGANPFPSIDSSDVNGVSAGSFIFEVSLLPHLVLYQGTYIYFFPLMTQQFTGSTGIEIEPYFTLDKNSTVGVSVSFPWHIVTPPLTKN